MTLLQILLQALGGMPLFDNITTAFGTAGTGGFGILSDSISSYSPYIQVVVTVFMALFGVNFGVYYLLLTGKPPPGPQKRGAAAVCGDFSGFHRFDHSEYSAYVQRAGRGPATCRLPGLFHDDHHRICHTNFDLWPEFSKAILLLLMMVGACAGSTGGGIKVSRVLLMAKAMSREQKRTVNPHTVSLIKMDGKVVGNDVFSGIWFYMSAYLLIMALSVVAVSLNNFGLETSISAVAACLNNIGPGFGVAGPMSCYATFSPLSKLVLCADMLLGRLEIIPLLMLWNPWVWAWNRSRRNR